MSVSLLRRALIQIKRPLWACRMGGKVLFAVECGVARSTTITGLW